RFFKPAIEGLEDRILMNVAPLGATLPTSQNPLDVQLGPITGTSFLDMLVLGADGQITEALNNGQGSWASVRTIDLGIGLSNGMSLTRWDADPFLDVLVQGPNGISLARGDGTGNFTLSQTVTPEPAGSLAPGTGHVQLATGLLNGDPFADLVTVSPGT